MWLQLKPNIARKGNIYKVTIGDKVYKTCATCGAFFEVKSNAAKYCPHCRKGYNRQKAFI